MDLFETFGRIALTFQSAPQGVPGRIWDELRPWLGRLVVNAAPKWLPRLAFGFPCSVPIYQAGVPVQACPRSALAACDVCGQPCCLAHARIDHMGDAICFLCCVEAVKRKAAERAADPYGAAGGPPPTPRGAIPEKDVIWARRALGVKKDTAWGDVTASYRRLMAKHHPDKHQAKGEASRVSAEEKFKDIRRAFDILSAVRDQEKKEAA